MDITLITGIEHRACKHVIERVLSMGMRVGVLLDEDQEEGPETRGVSYVKSNFSDEGILIKSILDLKKDNGKICGWINLAPEIPVVGKNLKEIPDYMRRNLSALLVIAGAILSDLKILRGNIIHVGWDGADDNSQTSLSAACHAGFVYFGKALFVNHGQDGLQFATIYPMARDKVYPNPEQIADGVETIFRFKNGHAITQLRIEPQVFTKSTNYYKTPSTIVLPKPEDLPNEPMGIVTPLPQQNPSKVNTVKKPFYRKRKPSQPKE